MAFVWEFVKIVLLGILEGVTEWLPISSTGHLLLFDRVLVLHQSEAFKEVFFVVIQLGAILAVVVKYGKRLTPIGWEKKKIVWKKSVLLLWGKVALSCVPGFLAVVLLDDFFEAHFHTPLSIAVALIVYGVMFLLPEKIFPKAHQKLSKMGFANALWIGIFQALSIVPGTSRSGATMLGARFCGMEKSDAAEFSFFMAVPVMFGYSLWKLMRLGALFTVSETAALIAGMLVSFAVSLAVISFLIRYLKSHSLSLFGWYRIVLGVLILVFLCR